MGSTGNTVNRQIEQLQKEYENAKGLFNKSKIKAKIRMLEAGWKGTFEEWKVYESEQFKKQREEQLKREEEKLKRDREEREKKERQTKESLENEFKTQPKDKVEQFKIIQENNPMRDDFHVGIRKPSDIMTWKEAINTAEEEGAFSWGDFSLADAKKALKSGKITIYSSYPIKQGVFVSTSKVQAEQYAGGPGNKVYSKTIPLDEVAWINGDEGQFAKRKKKGK